MNTYNLNYYINNKSPKPKYDWKFYWILAFIIVIGILLILHLNK